jgi:MFS family permease
MLNILPVLDNGYYAAPSTGKMLAFIIVLGLLLIAMGTYRSPAVALMPDVTPKPLRSRANAIINLMGAVGGIIYLAVAAVMYPNSRVQGLEHVNYHPLFLVVSAIMAVSIAVLLLTIREPQLAEENRALEAEHPEWNLAEDDGSGNEVLPVDVRRSLAFLLASIALWFIGYNGITTWFTTYVDKVMGQGLGGASTCLLIATAGAIVSYIPIGSLASKIGRKKTIMMGIVLLAACFLGGFFLTTAFHSINAIMFIVFALVGFAWAAINVNSLPMVVEMCRGSDIGKFTGYYYTASMAAQVITPILAGFLMRNVSYKVLFPYAALFVAFSFLTMTRVKHGDAAPEAKKGLEAFEDMDD